MNQKILNAIVAFDKKFNLNADVINNLNAENKEFFKQRFEAIFEKVPLIVKPYTQILNDLKSGIRCHNQGTFGPDEKEKHICGTAMCTCGHLIQLAGEPGWILKQNTSWEEAGRLIHMKAHPNAPCQDFGSIGDEIAKDYIELMAEYENQEKTFDEFITLKISE